VIRRALIAALVAAASIAATPAAASEAKPTAQDPVAAARAVSLAHQLRCLVCQNQSIAESNAELAVDLRRQIDEQIAAGRSDREIVDYMTARYGDFVLYRPPLNAATFLLWFGPALLLLAGVWALRRLLRARAQAAPERELSPAERERAARLLQGDAGGLAATNGAYGAPVDGRGPGGSDARSSRSGANGGSA
jgi:cytochrome c-type biogenesis protein CcmH